MKIGERIRELREERGMSQHELAIKSGYKGRSSISRIELCERQVPQDQAVRIAIALGVSPAELVEVNEDEVVTVEIKAELSDMDIATKKRLLAYMKGMNKKKSE